MKSFILILILLSSCSTQTKSKVYGAVSGALICGTLGAYLGNELSPDYESDNFNVLLGSASGAGLCALGGYHLGNVLYTSDPKNMEYEPIEFNKKQKSNAQVEINTGLDLSLSDLKFSGKEYANIPLIKKLPKSLKNKIKKQKIIKYQVEPQVIKTKNGRLLYFSGGEAIEHQYAQ